MLRLRLALSVALLTTASHAADITVNGNTISITGPIITSDYSTFLNKVLSLDHGTVKVLSLEHGTVILNSTGGQIEPALMIGRFINRNKWITYVPNTCNSACALIFLSGYERYKEFNANIGVHSSADNGTYTRSLVGNQMIEAYLTEMGYSHSFYEFFTQADPDKYQWLYQQSSEFYKLAIKTGKPPFIKVAITDKPLSTSSENVRVPIFHKLSPSLPWPTSRDR